MEVVGKDNWYFEYTGMTLLPYAEKIFEDGKKKVVELLERRLTSEQTAAEAALELARIKVLIHEFRRDPERVYRLHANDVYWFGIVTMDSDELDLGE